ncbi:MAG TPA: AMP-binding protein [Bryobacteraceae bacterium]|nr:AMP-binding protein [Bryobacteraceae bacterium]
MGAICSEERLAIMDRENLLEFFRDYFTNDRKCLIYDDGYRRWSYTHREIQQGAASFARRLQELNVNSGDRVLVWSESRPEWIFAFWGTLLAGAVVVPIGPELSADFTAKVRAIVAPAAIAVGEDVLPRAARLAQPAGPPVWRLAKQNWRQAPAALPHLPARAGDLAEIVFTSGSTGDPKGVQITHGNLLSQVESVERDLEFYRKRISPLFRTRLLQLLPLSHMFGQVITLGLAPLLSASAVITSRQSPAALVRLIRERHITLAACVPRVLDAMRHYVVASLPEAGEAGRGPSSLAAKLWNYRRIHSMFGWRFVGFLPGGAPLAAPLEDFWDGLGFLLVQGYGMTETSPVITLNDPRQPRKRSVGRPLPGVEVRIAGDDEVLVRGPNVTPGYYGEPEKTAAGIRNGWFHTGDLGFLDREGYLFLRGRKKEMIVTAEGLNVFPEDVERVLDALPGVRESAVIGVRPSGDGVAEEVHAVLVLNPGADSARIAADANRKLEAHQRIRGAFLWPEGSLPRTPETGKLRRSEILERVTAQPGRGREAAFAETMECRPEMVTAELARRSGRAVTAETRLDELGLGSIDKVELVLEIERRCHREIGEREASAAETVGGLAGSCRTRAARRSGANARRRPHQAIFPFGTGIGMRGPFGMPIWPRGSSR